MQGRDQIGPHHRQRLSWAILHSPARFKRSTGKYTSNLIPPIRSITDKDSVLHGDQQTWKRPTGNKAASSHRDKWMLRKAGAQSWFCRLSFTGAASNSTTCFEYMFSIVVTFFFLCSSISALATNAITSSQDTVQIGCNIPAFYFIKIEYLHCTTLCVLRPTLANIVCCLSLRHRYINITVSCIRVAHRLDDRSYNLLIWTLNCSKTDEYRTDPSPNRMACSTN